MREINDNRNAWNFTPEEINLIKNALGIAEKHYMEDIFNTLANITKPCNIPIVRHSNDLEMINNELKNDDSLFEYLKRNTMPIVGTWDIWYDNFFNEWVKSNENSFNGKMFYEWLLVNYCA